MKNLRILVKMQLKEQLNFKRLEISDVGVFHILVSVLGAVLKFALITALCAAFLIVSKMIGLFSFANLPIPDSVISLVFSVMLLMSVISCIIGLTKSMYYAKDNAVLLTLPCVPFQVYLSKLIIFFIFEIKRNFSFIVPLFIAYYITHGYGALAYPWMIVCILFVSLFTVAIGALLSVPAMWIANFFRQHRWLQLTTLFLAVGLAIVLLFYGISLIPENIDLVATWETMYWDIQAFLNSYVENFSVLYDLTLMLLGETKNLVTTFPFASTALRFGALVIVTAVLLVIGMLLVQPLFYKMASTPFEYIKKQIPPKPNKVRSRRYASVYNGFLVAFKSTDRMILNVGILVSVPMLVFLLNKIFLAMNTRELGNHMIIAFNILIILLVVLNANCYASSIFSRDGRSSYLIKTQPSKYPILILTRLLPNTVFVAISILATLVILLLTLPIGVLDTLFLTAAIGMAYLAHMLYCAELDLMNPQTELYATVGSSETNPNETKATVTAFIISFAVAAIMFLLLIEGVGINPYIKFAIVALGFLLYRVWLFFSSLRLYYKEK